MEDVKDNNGPSKTESGESDDEIIELGETEEQRKKREELEAKIKKEEERKKEDERRKIVLARLQIKKDIAFSDLFELGLARKATGCTLTAEIMEKIMDHWPNSKQIRILDQENDARSVFFYTDEPEPYFSLDDLKEGYIIKFRDPNLHFFMDGQMGFRVEEANLVSIHPNPDFVPNRRLVYAAAEKEDGSRWYKQKKWEEAIIRYDASLRHCERVPDETVAQRRREIEMPCNLNISACFLQQKKWDEVVKFSRKALEIQPDLPKAYYRMAQAQVQMRQFEQAEESYLKAIQLEPNDKLIKDGLKDLRAQKKERNEAELALWKGKLKSEKSSSSETSSTNNTSKSTKTSDTKTTTTSSKPNKKVTVKKPSKPWKINWMLILIPIGSIIVLILGVVIGILLSKNAHNISSIAS